MVGGLKCFVVVVGPALRDRCGGDKDDFLLSIYSTSTVPGIIIQVIERVIVFSLLYQYRYHTAVLYQVRYQVRFKGHTANTKRTQTRTQFFQGYGRYFLTQGRKGAR